MPTLSTFNDFFFDLLLDLLERFDSTLLRGMSLAELNIVGGGCLSRSSIPPQWTEIMRVMLHCHVDNVNPWNRTSSERSKEADTISLVRAGYIRIPSYPLLIQAIQACLKIR